MNIVITGSLGNIGKPLAENLIKKGNKVTIISSSNDKALNIGALGANAAIGSVLDTEFLVQTFNGADAVFCMIPPNYSKPDQIAYYKSVGKSYENAIKASGVKRVVHLSSYGAHLPSGTGFINGSYFVEQILNAVPGIALTHLRPTFFYYNLLAFSDMIKSAGFIGSIYGGEDKLTMVSPKDIASAAAEELLDSEKTRAFRYIASDDRTCSEIASILGKAIGKPDLKWLILSKEVVINAMKNHGMNEDAAAKYVELGAAIHTGKLREDYDLNKPEFGKVRLEDYASEFAKIYHSKSVNSPNEQ